MEWDEQRAWYHERWFWAFAVLLVLFAFGVVMCTRLEAKACLRRGGKWLSASGGSICVRDGQILDLSRPERPEMRPGEEP